MKNTHYCFGGHSCQDGCDCTCSICDKRRKHLSQEEFNARLSQKIKETFHDSEFRKLLVQELMKK